MSILKKTLLFTGSYSRPLVLGTGELVPGSGRGIEVFEFDRETGVLTKCSEYPEEPNPTYICVDQTKKYLYAVHELKEYQGIACGGAGAYRIDAETGHLHKLNAQITGGTDTAHIAVDETNQYVLTANFSSGSVCVLPRGEDGSLGMPTCFLQHRGSGKDSFRQAGPHPHKIVFDRKNRRVLVPDLGADEVVIYDFDPEKGYLIPAKAGNAKTPPGSGPRHLTFNEKGDRFYLINEIGNTINVFRYDQETGATELLQEIATIPADFAGESIAAAIKIHPNGKLLYGSNRGHDSLAAYRIDEQTGLLTLLGIYPCGAKNPRDFDIDSGGKWLITGGQDSNNLVVFRVSEETGELTKVSETEGVNAVTGILLVEL